LELLAIDKLQLELELTDAYFSVITGFKLQLLLTGITLVVVVAFIQSGGHKTK